ncbi:MAG: LD-carboxypeptidase [Candidatus Cloacimonetes bacterium]|nr:LD-carboxypeptidase [Candidatus Cloacimonadota bacterium]
MRTLRLPRHPHGTPPRVGLVAPAGPVKAEALDAGVRWLREQGFEVWLSPGILDVHGHLAGRDESRAAHLQTALCDPRLDIVMAARGGFGCARLLRHLDFEAIGERAPLLVGYSDLTALQLALLARCGLGSLHAPMAASELGAGLDESSAQSLRPFLQHGFVAAARQEIPLDDLRTRVPGNATGFIAGGNLSVLTSLVGTPWFPDLRAAILFLEDYGEYPFRVDRHLCQLRNAGVLEGLAGVVLGHFPECDEPDHEKSTFSLNQLFEQYLDGLGIPVLQGLNFGHRAPRLSLPIGGTARIDGAGGVLVLEPETDGYLASADRIR